MLNYDNYYNLRYVIEVKPEGGKLSLLNIIIKLIISVKFKNIDIIYIYFYEISPFY